MTMISKKYIYIFTVHSTVLVPENIAYIITNSKILGLFYLLFQSLWSKIAGTKKQIAHLSSKIPEVDVNTWLEQERHNLGVQLKQKYQRPINLYQDSKYNIFTNNKRLQLFYGSTKE